MNELTAGIIIGLGIPYLIIMGILARRCCCPTCCRCMTQKQDDMELARVELTFEAYNDFLHGRLTAKLYSEITHLYALKGDLSAYKRIAKNRRHVYLSEFLNDPTRHPFVVQAMMRNDRDNIEIRDGQNKSIQVT
jgi:hypothetical protein